MKLRRKPSKPKRVKQTYTVNAWYESLAQIKENLFELLLSHGYTKEEAEKFASYENIQIKTEWDYDNETPVGKIEVPMSIAEYNKLLSKYEQQSKRYNKWVIENGDAIEAEKQNRKALKEKALKDQIDKLNKKLERVKT